MNNSKFKIQNFRLLVFCILHFAFCVPAYAQSTSIEYPTAVSTNEISGQIAARDVGDARLTAYYYKFEGTQGDIFINVSAANFNGDVDIYVADGLRPLAKITFYGDSQMTETGRVIYLRKPEKLILRVEGRTPDDNPAMFKIKFAGSFVAVAPDETEQPKLPEVKARENAGIRVNSVGTIIAVKPKPTPAPTEIVAETKTEEEYQPPPPPTDENKTKVVVTDNLETAAKTEESKTGKTTAKTTARRNTRRNTARNSRAAAAGKGNARRNTTPPPKTTTAAPLPNPLENVRLVVEMKNGDRLEFPMTEVFRFAMNNGVLTVVTKDGKVHRRSILEIQKMTVE